MENNLKLTKLQEDDFKKSTKRTRKDFKIDYKLLYITKFGDKW